MVAQAATALYAGVVVQLVRIPACHAGVAGSSPVHSATNKAQLNELGFFVLIAAVAQR